MKTLEGFCKFMEEYLDEKNDPLERQKAVVATTNQRANWEAPGRSGTYRMYDVSRKNKEGNREINKSWHTPERGPEETDTVLGRSLRKKGK